ncbi:MAG TPA: NAD(P)/FAD-dependent oxidoreductase [Lunatimonas sp.]|nr:NAD(P)/FAD-dependent oxidoreductase [Lunatimonas sp.]
MKDRKIYIIGAGISGLVAAIELEKAGYFPVILESKDRVGGRIKTDLVDGYLLDHGFQVLLTSYPEAQRYLDFDALDLKHFHPGAMIFDSGEIVAVHDPLRRPTQFLNMAFSKVGNVFDKIKIYRLTKELKGKHEEEIFSAPEMTTSEYLKKRGFSEKMIRLFFRPFFAGIFLEEELQTSSRMFEFVFKMFSIGYAAIPARGMMEIPKQLAARLHSTQFRFNTSVSKITHTEIHLESGDVITADDIILTIPPVGIVDGITEDPITYQGVTNLYFSLQRSFIAQPIISLVPNDSFLINNFVFMTDVSKEYSSNGRALLSVSIIKDVSGIEKLEKLIPLELEVISGIKAEHFEFIMGFKIDDALPITRDLKYAKPSHHHEWHDHLFLAGDHLLNGSINAAMQSGRSAAEAVIAKDLFVK